jgi:hypothetical protein
LLGVGQANNGGEKGNVEKCNSASDDVQVGSNEHGKHASAEGSAQGKENRGVHGVSLQAQARVGVDQASGVADGGKDVRQGLGKFGQGDQLVDVEVDLGLHHVVQGLQLGLGHGSLFHKIPNIVRWVGNC